MKLVDIIEISNFATKQFDVVFRYLPKYEYEIEIDIENNSIWLYIYIYKNGKLIWDFQMHEMNKKNYITMINKYALEMENGFKDDYIEYLQNKEDSLREQHFDSLEDK